MKIDLDEVVSPITNQRLFLVSWDSGSRFMAFWRPLNAEFVANKILRYVKGRIAIENHNGR